MSQLRWRNRSHQLLSLVTLQEWTRGFDSRESRIAQPWSQADFALSYIRVECVGIRVICRCRHAWLQSFAGFRHLHIAKSHFSTLDR